MSNELSLWVKKIGIVLLVSLILYLLYTLSSLVLTIVISGFLTILINPLAERGEKRNIPAWITVIAVYIIILLLASIVIGTVIPIVINFLSDTANLVISWANTIQKIYTEQGISGFHVHPYLQKIIVFVL
jgi:predicted PurR-regulated permease PerM